MAKPIITDKPIVDQASFGDVIVWKKEGGSIEVSDTNYPNVKAALQDISRKSNFDYDETWTSQQLGSKLINYLKTLNVKAPIHSQSQPSTKDMPPTGGLTGDNEMINELLDAFASGNKVHFEKIYKQISDRIKHSNSIVESFILFKENFGRTDQEIPTDEEYEEIKTAATELVGAQPNGPTSFLQRKLSWGYEKSQKAVETLQKIGVLEKEGQYMGPRPQVIIDNYEKLDEVLSNYKNGAPSEEFIDYLNLWEGFNGNDPHEKIFSSQKLNNILHDYYQINKKLQLSTWRNCREILSSRQKEKEKEEAARKNSNVEEKLSVQKPKEQKVCTKTDDKITVNVSFKIKKLFGWQRETHRIKITESEYKALLRGSDKNRKNFVINHANSFDLGFIGLLNVESIDGVTIERD